MVILVTLVGAQQPSEQVDPHNHLYQLELLLSPTPRRRPSYIQHNLLKLLLESKAKCMYKLALHFPAPHHEGFYPRLTLILGGGEICASGAEQSWAQDRRLQNSVNI